MKITFFKIIIFSLAIFILTIFYISLKEKNIYSTKNLIGQNISSFELDSLNEDLKINEEALKLNNFTLINFWASWCLPCRLEHKYLMRLKSESPNLKILGINYKDKKNDDNKFILDMGNPFFFLAQDVNGKSSVNFGIFGIPESILINKELKVLKKFIGPINEDDYKDIIKSNSEFQFLFR